MTRQLRIGIVGGMGPAAGVYFVQKLTEMAAASKDQDHPVLLHISNSQIPDRTAYLLGKGTDPVPEITRTLNDLEQLQADVICLPCNTAHAPELFSRYSYKRQTPIIHMVQATMEEIHQHFPRVKRVGLLATTGTVAAGSYQQVAADYNIRIVTPPLPAQKQLMELIYRIKSRGQLTRDAALLHSLSQTIDVDLYILGCTELSMLSAMFRMLCAKSAIDSLEILAGRALRFHKQVS